MLYIFDPVFPIYGKASASDAKAFLTAAAPWIGLPVPSPGDCLLEPVARSARRLAHHITTFSSAVSNFSTRDPVSSLASTRSGRCLSRVMPVGLTSTLGNRISGSYMASAPARLRLLLNFGRVCHTFYRAIFSVPSSLVSVSPHRLGHQGGRRWTLQPRIRLDQPGTGRTR